MDNKLTTEERNFIIKALQAVELSGNYTAVKQTLAMIEMIHAKLTAVESNENGKVVEQEPEAVGAYKAYSIC